MKAPLCQDILVEGSMVLVQEHGGMDGAQGPGEIEVFHATGGSSEHLEGQVRCVPKSIKILFFQNLVNQLLVKSQNG